MAILISNNSEIKRKGIIKNKEIHCIRIKCLTHQNNITFMNTYVPNNIALPYMKQKIKRTQ
jgi:hypothetical protein